MLVVVAKWHHHAILLTYSYSYSFFLDNSVQRGKGAIRLTLCEAPTHKSRPDHYTGNSVPYSLQQVCGFFNFSSCTLYNIWRCRGRGLWFIVLIREDRNILPLQVLLQRQHVLLSVGPVWGSNLRPPTRQSGALPTELTSWRCFLLNFTEREVSLYRVFLRAMTLSGCLS